MKRLLFILIAPLFLLACGTTKETNKAHEILSCDSSFSSFSTEHQRQMLINATRKENTKVTTTVVEFFDVDSLNVGLPDISGLLNGTLPRQPPIKSIKNMIYENNVVQNDSAHAKENQLQTNCNANAQRKQESLNLAKTTETTGAIKYDILYYGFAVVILLAILARLPIMDWLRRFIVRVRR